MQQKILGALVRNVATFLYHSCENLGPVSGKCREGFDAKPKQGAFKLPNHLRQLTLKLNVSKTLRLKGQTCDGFPSLILTRAKT